MSISSRLVLVLFLFTIFNIDVFAQRRRAPTGGRVAIVVDERLAALRDSPLLSAALIRRLSRGRLVAIRSDRRVKDGLTFSRVNVTSRTSGWIQRDALVIPNYKPDEERLFKLIEASEDFDRLARARIFLDEFPKSVLRPAVLLMFGDAAESAAANLSRDAARRLKDGKSSAVPEFSYYMNYVGLDRYNRKRIRFVFDREQKRFHYDGAVWNELAKRFPNSPEAEEARRRFRTRMN
jgi:hypothetical protein